jgi:hypothetical protein
MSKYLGRWVAAALVCAVAVADAAVTTVAYYRLGEADPGAVVGAVAANPTLPSTGAVNLPRIGSPVYSAQSFVRPTPIAVAFNGSTDGFRVAAPISAVTDNFGIEAWVRPNSVAGNSVIAYNGDTSTSGGGIFRAGSDYGVLYGGNVLATVPNSVTLNQWTHLAIVRSAGTTTIYKNGVAIGSTATGPNAPAGGFSIGINPTAAAEFFSGEIDEVRMFTFTAGQFATSDLLTGLSYTQPTPVVPATSWQTQALMLLALFGFGAWMLRRRQSR